MKKLFLFIIFALIISCDDGDFDIPSFNFEGKTIENCDANLILFKINESEVLILDTDITNTANIFFKTAAENDSIVLTDQIYYRIFDNTVSTTYFCQDIPPTTPKIIKEWIGSGTLNYTNSIVDNGDNTATATTIFTISNLSLSNTDGNQINYDSYDFETKTTTYSN